MALDDYPVNVRPFYVAETRIAYFATAGAARVLDGVHYDKEGSIKAIGEDVMPLIQPLEYTFSEADSVSSKDIPGPSLGNLPQVCEVTMQFLIVARRIYGFIDRGTASKYDGRGVLEWIARLQDALEKKVSDGTTDPFMEGTLSRPLKFNIKESFVSDLGFAMILEATSTTIPYLRGARTPAA